MESVHLFYSWQSDRGSKLCRDFIARALAAAAARIEAARGIVLRIDSDTAGVAGTPHITETILAKIRACDIFVGDMTFVGRADSGKLVTNPNVMVEYGYARHAKGDHRILLVMNAAFGSFRKLPFDLRHMRRPTEYSAAADIGDAALETAAADFTELLVAHLGIVVDEVLADRAVALEGGDFADKARAHLAELDAMAARNDMPATVPNPRLLVRLAPMNMPATAPFEFAQVKDLRPRFVPAGFASERREDRPAARQWASFDPLSPVAGRPNGQARWFTRIVLPGLFELAVTIGYAEDEDEVIGVDGFRLEARVVDAVRRLAALASDLGYSGPALVVPILQGVETVALLAPRVAGRRFPYPSLSLGELILPSLDMVDALSLRPILNNLWLDAGFEDGSPSFGPAGWAGDSNVPLYSLD